MRASCGSGEGVCRLAPSLVAPFFEGRTRACVRVAMVLLLSSATRGSRSAIGARATMRLRPWAPSFAAGAPEPASVSRPLG